MQFAEAIRPVIYPMHVQLLQSLCISTLLQQMLNKNLNMFWPPAVYMTVSAVYDIASRSGHNVKTW
jgi:hypothetical protein